MSFKAQKWAWEQQTPTPLTQLLLFAIAQSENDEKGYAWCSHQYLADKCRCTRRAIVKNISILEAAGYIRVDRQLVDGMKVTNHYSCNYSYDVNDIHIDVNEVHMGCERGSLGGSERGSHKQITSFNRLVNTPAEPVVDYWKQSGLEAEYSAFKKMRQQCRKPLNDVAISRLIAKHKKLVEAGDDPAEIINLATERCWASFFPAKKESAEKVPTNIADINRLIREKSLQVPENCDLFTARKAISMQTGMAL